MGLRFTGSIGIRFPNRSLMYFRLYAIVFYFIVRESESLHHFVLPSILSIFCSLLDGFAGMIAGIVVYVVVALVAKALKSIKSAINGETFHFFECVGRLDGDDVMHNVCFHESSLA